MSDVLTTARNELRIFDKISFKTTEALCEEIERLREDLREIRACTFEYGGVARTLRIIKAALAREEDK